MIDYPFDDSTHGPADDVQRVHDLRSSGRHQYQTVCWIPTSLTTDRLRELGRLVMLDALLSGQRFDSHAKHLSRDERQRAHATLTSQRDALVVKLKSVLRQAYGLASKQPGDVLTTFDDHLLTLSPGLKPSLPFGAKMSEALRDLAGQMLAHQFPAHPNFDPDNRGEPVRVGEARLVLEVVRRAVESREGRTEVERKDRTTVRRIANPLRLGEMHEAAFVLGRDWVEHFHRLAAKEGITGDLRVKDLWRWLDQPEARGLDPLIARLVVAVFAEQTDRTWVQHGATMVPQPDFTKITEELALRTAERPTEEEWETARQRAMEIFGFTPAALPRGRLIAMFVQDLSTHAKQHRDAAHRLVEALEKYAQQLGLDPQASSGRLHTARAAANLLDGLVERHDSIDIIRYLARAPLGGPPHRTGRSIRSAAQVTDALTRAAWHDFENITKLDEQWSARAQRILDRLRAAAADDELTTALAPALEQASSEAKELVSEVIINRPKPPAPSPSTGDPRSGTMEVAATKVAEAIDELRQFADQHHGKTIKVTWQVVE